MARKYLKLRKILIPTMAILMMTSQMTGCSSVEQSENEAMQASNEFIEVTVPELMTEEEIANMEPEQQTQELQEEVHTEVETESDMQELAEEALEIIEEQGIVEVTEDIPVVDEAYEQIEEAGQAEFTVADLSLTMYAVNNCNVRKGPDADTYERVGAYNKGDEVIVTGKVNEAEWYRVSLSNGTEAYVSGSLLSETKPLQQAQSQIQSAQSEITPSTPDTTPSEDVQTAEVHINPNTGEPLKVGDTGVTEGVTWTWLGDI